MTGIERFTGHRLPDGAYTIDAEDHAAFLAAVDGIASRDGHAHPLFGFLATHCGMGLSFREFMELLGTTEDAGAMFGQEALELNRPLRIGETFTVRGLIVEARSTSSQRLGPLDIVTCALELVDADREVACRSRETYVIPRRTA